MPIRQATLLLFLVAGTALASETTLYDELSFLEESAKSVDVSLPGSKSSKAKVKWITDEVSTGQAGLLKKPKEIVETVQKDKKKLRYRSR
jgi:hypothetical protein